MARNVKLKHERGKPVSLPRDIYFEIRALRSDLAAAELQATPFIRTLQVADAALQAAMKRAAAQHGFDPDQTFGFDDKQCRLVPAQLPPTAPPTGGV